MGSTNFLTVVRPLRERFLVSVTGASVLGIAAIVAALAGSAAGRPNPTDARATPGARPEALGSSLPGRFAASTGRTFYISQNGSDRNPGTPRRPWRTIQHSLNRLQPGQRALVRGGTYSEDLVMSRSGTGKRPITLAAYPGQRVVLHAASTSGDTYPIQITGSYFRLQGFVIERSTGTSAANVYLEDSASHVELSGNEIRYGQDQGIFADPGTSSIQILGNRIHDNGWNHLSGQHQSHGIYIEGSNDLIANNVIYDHAKGFGIQVYPRNHDTVIVNNTVVANGHSGIVVGGDGGVRNIVIRNNIFASNRNWGVESDSTCPTSSVVVDHSLFYRNPAGGIEAGCSAIDSSGGNMTRNPRFLEAGLHEYQLRRGSPAINRALPAYAEPRDLLGRSRRHRGAPDIGAFEFRR